MLTAARPDGDIYRVGRGPDPWVWPTWEYAGEGGTFGNRYDDPRGEYRVLYASSPRAGTLIETLARFRVNPELTAAHEEIHEDPDDAKASPTIPPGVVPPTMALDPEIGSGPARWFVRRSPDLAIASPPRTAPAGRLSDHGLDDPAAVICADERRARYHPLPVAAWRRHRELGDLRAPPALRHQLR
jgi:hypothetical protein